MMRSPRFLKRVPLTLLAVVALATSTLSPQASAGQPDERSFETGYRIDNDAFWDYFQRRGGAVSFGLPVSRAFPFLGCTAQFFQRLVMQRCGNAGVGTLNMLDEGLLPYTSFNGSVVPGVDDGLKRATPRADDPDYGAKIITFVKSNAPDSFDGEPVNFGQKFFATLSPAAAGTSDPNLLGLLALEIWGAPTSAPAHDPGNTGFIYQRFQRGIMHYDRSCRCTQGLLLADYLKAVTTGQNLPGDLENQARAGSLYRSAVDRPQPDGTDFTGAFNGVKRVSPGVGQVDTPMSTATPAPEVLPTSTRTPVPAEPTATSLPAIDPLLGDLKSQLPFQEPIGSACSAQPATALSIDLRSQAVEFPDVPVVCFSPLSGSNAPVSVTLKQGTNVVSTDQVSLGNLANGWQWVKAGSQPPAPGTYTIEARQGASSDSATVTIDPPTQPRVVIYPRRGDPGTTFRIFLARFQPNEKVTLGLYRCDVPSGCSQIDSSNPLTKAALLGPVQTDGSGRGVFSLPTGSSSPARLYVVYPDGLVKAQSSIFVGNLGKPWFCLTSSASCKTENG